MKLTRRGFLQGLAAVAAAAVMPAIAAGRAVHEWLRPGTILRIRDDNGDWHRLRVTKVDGVTVTVDRPLPSVRIGEPFKVVEREDWDV